MATVKLPRFRKGDVLKASDLNKMMESIERALNITVDGSGMELVDSLAGKKFRVSSSSGRWTLGISTSAFTARSAKTPGAGTVQPYIYDGSALITSGPAVTVLNWTGSAVTTNIWVAFVARDGAFWLDGTDCSGVVP